MARKFAGRLPMPSGPFGKVGMYNLFTMQRMGTLPLFSAPLLTSLILAAGVGLPTYSRATIATVTDWEGIVRQVASGEARFSGARRVQNQVTGSSENFTLAPYGSIINGTASAPIKDFSSPLYFNGVRFNATRLQLALNGGNTVNDRAGINVGIGAANARAFSIILQSNTAQTYNVQIRVGGQVRITSVSPVAQRFCVTTTGDGDATAWVVLRGAQGTSDSCDILATAWQVELVDGQTNTAPGDYVSVGVLATPFQGAGIDGVQYFPNSNGNTVGAGGVLVPGSGTPIPSATLLGYLPEGARTNLALFSEDFTNAAWVKTGVTVTPNTFLAPNGTVTADTLTATTPLATCLQAVTITAANQVVSCWVRRRTGVGAIQLSADGIAFTPIAVTGVFQRFQVMQNLGAGVVNAFFRIDVSGDEIDVWGAQYETGNFMSSYTPTGAATVTRNSDTLTYPSVGNMNTASGTIYGEVSIPDLDTGSRRWFGHDAPSVNRNELARAGGFYVYNYGNGTAFEGLNNGIAVANSVVKHVASWGAIGGRETTQGLAVTTDAVQPVIAQGTALNIGAGNGGLGQLFGNIRNVQIWGQQLPDSTLQSLTT